MHNWQKNLAQDVATHVKRDLTTGRVPWLSYTAPELGNKLVREFPDGERCYVTRHNGKLILKPAPRREQ